MLKEVKEIVSKELQDTLKIYFIGNFKYTVSLTIIIMLYIRSPELIHVTESLYPLPNFSFSQSSIALGKNKQTNK